MIGDALENMVFFTIDSSLFAGVKNLRFGVIKTNTKCQDTQNIGLAKKTKTWLFNQVFWGVPTFCICYEK